MGSLHASDKSAHRQRALRRGLALAVFAGLLSCNPAEESTQKEIPIGFLVFQEDATQTQKDTARLLVGLRQINEQGGVQIGGVNYRLTLVTEDHEGTPAGGVRAIERFAEQGVTVVVGPPWSSLALGELGDGSDGAIAAAREHGVLLVSGSATAPAISDAPDDDLMWRTVPSDSFQAGLAASLVYEEEAVTTAAILARNDAWGTGLSSAFMTEFERLGGTITTSNHYDVSDGNLDALLAYDYESELDEVFADSPGVLYLLAFDEFTAISAAIIAGGYLDSYPAGQPLIFVSDSVYDENTLANVPTAILTRLRGTSQVPDPDNEYFTEFEELIVSEGSDKPEIYDAARYDAAFLIALAMQQADSTGADSMKAELASVSNDEKGDTLIGFGEWSKAREVLLQGGTVNYDGPSGPIDFSPEGDPTNGTFVVWGTKKSGDEFEFETLDTVTYDAD